MFTMFLCTLNVIDFFADSNPFNLWRLKGRVTHVLEESMIEVFMKSKVKHSVYIA